MRWLIWYFRSVFCKHTWERVEAYCKSEDLGAVVEGMRVSATCSQCGWHRSYWKF